MGEVKSTRLRYIASSSLDDIVQAVGSLPFKVELKGQPVKDGKKWVVWFVIPDYLADFKSVTL